MMIGISDMTSIRIKLSLLLFIFINWKVNIILALCPSKCNGHGTCTPTNNCVCDSGYKGFDCMSLTCPSDIPWVDYATANDEIRTELRECSNMGTCNSETGICTCEPGFAGAACQRLQLCGDNCNERGTCMTLKDAATQKNDRNLLYSNTYTAPWDAEKILGCVCDPGYAGITCEQQECPYGDDPLSTGQLDEIQAVSCICNGCIGTFTMSFRGETTRPLDGSRDTAVTLKEALEALQSIRAVDVSLDGGTTLCDMDGVSMLITFTHDHGDVPALIITTSFSTGSHSISVEHDGNNALFGTNIGTQSGTKEWIPCSGRGQCDQTNGVCTCETGFEASDGQGGPGTIGDCGYASPSVISTCGNGLSSTTCSSHGRCSGAPDYKCTCDHQFLGHVCSKRSCPMGRSWFEEPQADNVAHQQLTECSSAGICDPATGLCKCLEGMEGVACEKVACPELQKRICSNRGTCKTLRELAVLAPTQTFSQRNFVYGVDLNSYITWDADRIQGCYCDKVHFSKGLNVRYTGHNCSKIPCPVGDDPWTGNQPNEVQLVTCNANGGFLTLSFRGETTVLLPISSSSSTIALALENLRTIHLLTVKFSDGISTACTANGNAPAGPNLPLIEVDSSMLSHSTSSVNVNVIQHIKGMKEEAICNNRGRCDETTGQCICAKHYASSNGQGDYGILNDCGVVDEFMTHGSL